MYGKEEKRNVLAAFVLLCVLVGCVSAQHARPPLGSGTAMPPPPGCVELRRNGGAC